jgi:hypothetical protein
MVFPIKPPCWAIETIDSYGKWQQLEVHSSKEYAEERLFLLRRANPRRSFRMVKREGRVS